MTQQQGGTEPLYAWQITGVEDQTNFTPGVGPAVVKRVRFQLWNGVNSYIDVPADKFDPKTVGPLVDAAAQKLADVLSLTGPIVNPT